MFKVGDVIPGDRYPDGVPRVVLGWVVKIRGAASPRWVETFGAEPTTNRHRDRAHLFTKRRGAKAEAAFWTGAKTRRVVAKCRGVGMASTPEEAPLRRLAADLFDGAVLSTSKARAMFAVLQEVARVAGIGDDEPLVEALEARLRTASLGEAA